MMPLRSAFLAAVIIGCASMAAASKPTLRQHADRVETSPAGLWMAGDDAIFEIVRTANDTYECRLLRSPDFASQPGTVFGTLHSTGKAFVYEGRFADKLDNIKGSRTKGKRHTYICRFDPTYSRISFEHYNRGMNLNLLRALPYLFRAGMERNHRRPQDVDGATRLCTATINTNPVIL